MKKGFYPKIAMTGIRQNRRLYVPYILTCMGMVMMYYIVSFLATTDVFSYMRGGSQVQAMLGFGTFVIAVFSVIFLFYTNSFLMRRRKKEFGLYNILGMDKRNIGKVLFWENVIVVAIALILGLALGVLFSKLAELALINMLKGNINYQMHFEMESLIKTLVLFLGIFVLIFLGGLRQVHTANPVDLLHSENLGEKPPKANWLFGTAGIIILAAAYYIAVSIKEPMSAIIWFFIAVIMVIIATYLIFIAGSVLLCKILQKKKKYYYKANHFVSVSSMSYRMKRNGAGLASICILGTMVLVMITGSACLYFGAEDSLSSRYPRDISANITLESSEAVRDENIDVLKEKTEEVLMQSGIEKTEPVYYRKAMIYGLMNEETARFDAEVPEAFTQVKYDNLRMINFIPLSDYNKLMGTDIHLGSNQVMIYPVRCDYDSDTFSVEKGKEFEVAKVLDEFTEDCDTAMDMVPSIVVVVRDFEDTVKPLEDIEYEGQSAVTFKWYYGIDTDQSAQKEAAAANQLRDMYKELISKGSNGVLIGRCESLEANRDDFYGTYGGIFFLGILLSIVFIAGAALIIYYKQISEGYEDKSRFEIMQKVGMTKKNIRKSINSQMLTVFFMPLLAAVIHLCFAFPLIYRLLMLFNLRNLPLLIFVAAVSVTVFAVFYVLVYRITSNSYYKIVSEAKRY